MKNAYLLIILLISTQFCIAQFYISSGDEVYVSSNQNLYSNESIQNNGTITLNNNSHLIFDADLVNNDQIVYQIGTDKAVLQIGSGEVTSNQPQDIQFNPNSTEEAPFLVLNKVSETATVTRGHMRLLETFVSTSGILDANSYINAPDAVTDPGRVFGLTFANPDITSIAQVDISTGGDVRNVLIERFIPAGDNNRKAFRFLTSSVNSSGSINANWQEGVTTNDSNPNPNPGYGTHITGGTISDGFDQNGSGNPSMFTFDNTNQNGTVSQDDDWFALPNTNSKTLKAGEAYLTFIRGDRSIDVTNNSAIPTNTTLRAIGDLYVGSFTFSSANNSTIPEYGLSDQTEFFNLVGNPYQAIVDINNLDFTNVKSNFYWIWDPNLGSQGQYTTVTITNGINNTTSSANQFIQPGQSFYVQTIANGTASLTFNEDDKDISGEATTIFSEQNDPSIHLFLFTTNAFNTGNKESDGILINFSENANNATDIFDADKFFGPGENLARLNSNELISIEDRAMPTDDEILALTTTGYTEDNYTFVANATNVQNNFEAYLLDNYTGTQTLLNEGATQINYSIDSNIPESFASDRFSIIFDNTTLGVNENSFGVNFTLYPNPTKDGHFSIKTPSLSGEVEVEITNIIGQQLKKEILSINGNEVNVKATGLSSGVYLVKLSQSEKSFKTKFIIE